MGATLKDVLDFIRSPQMSSGDRSLIVDALNAQTRSKRAQARANLWPGQKVTFYSARYGRNIVGYIRKVNRVNVDLDEQGTGMKWRVAPQLLKPYVDGKPGEENEF